MKNMSIDSLISSVSEKLAHVPVLGARYKFELGDDVICMDATQSPPVLTKGDGEADTTLTCAPDVLQAIIDGTQDPTMAYMMGKLKIKGSMGYAMKLSSLLAD